MISLNLLPQKEILTLRREKIYQIITFSLIIPLLGTIILGFELFVLRNLLKENFIFHQYQVDKNEEKKIADEVKILNSQFVVIDKIQNEYLELTPVLISLAKIAPERSQIKVFVLDYKNKKFRIAGQVKEKESLLEFQNNLEGSETFTKIETIIPALLRRENIEFEFKGELNL